MAQKGVQLARETFSCSLCLDLLNHPVTIPCGHSYCMDCINKHWDKEDDETIYSCPQCSKTFEQRPDLLKSTMLAVLVEELKKTGLQAAPADHCYAGPEDVACDICTGRKRKAIKSCLQCVASYCEEHLQPHFKAPALQKHKLVEPSKKLQENICSHHSEVMKMFCRTDQQSICYLCSLDQHKGHDIVSAAEERTERQRELQGSRQNIQQRIQDREKHMKLLQQDVEAINSSADKAVENSEKIFTEMIRLVEQRRSDVKQQLRSQQEAEVSRVKEVQEKLEQEITELKSRDAELEKLSLTEDDMQFLLDHPSLSKLQEPAASPSISTHPLTNFEDLTATATTLKEKLQDILTQKQTNISHVVTEVDLSEPSSPQTNLSHVVTKVYCSEPSLPQPKTSAEFLQYAFDITMDPNTANEYILLTDGNRKVTVAKGKQTYYSNTERFTQCRQVMSRVIPPVRRYWEVNWRGPGVRLAVAYSSISRAGSINESGFGLNDKSWALEVDRNSYSFWHNDVKIPVSGPQSSRIGVYLDHSVGVLSFFCVSGNQTMTLLHTVQTTFTQPLHAGLWMWFNSTAEFIKLM